MSFSRRKPYNMLGVRNKRLGGGYGTKMSMREMMHSPARYLKEKQKESIYEKPYLDLSRPQMHQQWPWPSVDVSPWPWVDEPPPTDPNYLIQIFAPGLVSVFVRSPATCGATKSGSGFLGLQAPHSGQDGPGERVWNIYSSNSEIAQIQEVDLGQNTSTVSFKVKTKKLDEDDEVEICADVMHKGDMLHIVAVPEYKDGNLFKNMPADWEPSIHIADPGAYGTPSRPPTVSVLPIDVWHDYQYPTECFTLQIDKCEEEEEECDTSTPIAWAEGNGDTITRNNSIALSVTGSGAPFSWNAVGGEGMTVDTDEESNSVLLVADGTACGSVTVTCTDCDGNPASGSIRCTSAGSWQDSVYTCGEYQGVHILVVCDTYEGQYWYHDEKSHRACVPISPCTGTPMGCTAKDVSCAADCTPGGCGTYCCYGLGDPVQWCCGWDIAVRRRTWNCVP